jgi:hypothetical protein
MRIAGQCILASNIEATQSLDQMPRNLADRGMPSPVIAIGEGIEQRRGGGRERDL